MNRLTVIKNRFWKCELKQLKLSWLDRIRYLSIHSLIFNNIMMRSVFSQLRPILPAGLDLNWTIWKQKLEQFSGRTFFNSFKRTLFCISSLKYVNLVLVRHLKCYFSLIIFLLQSNYCFQTLEFLSLNLGAGKVS